MLLGNLTEGCCQGGACLAQGSQPTTAAGDLAYDACHVNPHVDDGPPASLYSKLFAAAPAPRGRPRSSIYPLSLNTRINVSKRSCLRSLRELLALSSPVSGLAVCGCRRIASPVPPPGAAGPGRKLRDARFSAARTPPQDGWAPSPYPPARPIRWQSGRLAHATDLSNSTSALTSVGLLNW